VEYTPAALALWLAAWGRAPGAGRWPGPDQHFAILIHGHVLSRNDLVFQVLQVGIVKAELPLEGVIGHTSPLAQQVQDLIQYCIKIHGYALLERMGDDIEPLGTYDTPETLRREPSKRYPKQPYAIGPAFGWGMLRAV